MTRPEQFANDAHTTLATPIGARETTIRVASSDGFPVQPQFRVLIDDELVIVTAGTGTTTWTVVRGAEGTRATPHGRTAVTHIVTAAALASLRGPWINAGDYGGDLHAALEAGAGRRVVVPAGVHAFEQTLHVAENTLVELLPGAILRCNVQTGGPGISIANGGKLLSACGGSLAAKVLASSSCRIDSLITNSAHDASQELIYLEGLCLLVEAGAMIGTALVHLASVFVNSGIRDCIVVGGDVAPVGILIAGGAKAGFGPVYIDDVWVNTCRRHNIVITERDPMTGSATCWLTNVTSENQGDGFHALHLEGHGGLYNVRVRNFHYEHGHAVSSPTAAIFVDGVPGFSLDGADIIALPPQHKLGVVISSNPLNHRIQVRNVHNVNAVSPILDDRLGGVTFGSNHVGFYETASGEQRFANIVHAAGGIATKVVRGPVSDADFPAPPPDGTLAVGDDHLYVRVNGRWKSVTLR